MNAIRLPWIIAAAMVVASFALGAVVAWTILHTPFVFGGAGGGVTDQPRQFFTIDGDLTEPLSPGTGSSLNLSITNPLDSALAVSKLLVEVDAVDAPNATAEHPCDVDDFAVDQFAGYGSLILEADSTSTLADLGVPNEDWPIVRMLDTEANQDGCKDATLSLSYSAEGRIVE
jgi:hypothetical protein